MHLRNDQPKKPNFILFFLISLLIFFVGSLLIVLIVILILSLLITVLLTGMWEIDTFDKYYRYLMACIPVGHIAAIESTVKCWIRTRKQ